MRRHKSLIQTVWELREAINAMLEHPECPASIAEQLSALCEDLSIQRSDNSKNGNGSIPVAQRSDVETFADIIQQNDKLIANLLQVALKPEIKRDTVYTYREVAALTGVSSQTISRAVEAGRLKANYVGSKPRVRGAAILQWLDEGGKTGCSRK